MRLAKTSTDVAHTWHNEAAKKWAPNQKISRKGAVRQAYGPPFDSAQGQ